MHSLCDLRRGLVTGALTLVGAVLAAGLAGAQAPPETKTFENGQFHFTVALPAGCRHELGPGTIDAICSPDFDAERSGAAAKAGALVLSVAAETAADAGKTGSELQQRLGEAGFREELPEAVCGESDKARVRIANVKEVVEAARVVYSADVVCTEVKFLQIGERRATVRYVATPEARYRLVARALAEDFDKQRETIDAFFASFQALPATK
jgi:hypothetical protein